MKKSNAVEEYRTISKNGWTMFLSMETKENLSKCQQKSQELFVWKSKKSFLEKCDTTAKYNISLAPVVEHAPGRYPIKSPPDYTCHDYRRHYCHFCSDANQIWMAFLSERRGEVTDVSGRNFGGETLFWVDFRGMVPLKDESRLRDGDDPVRAERRGNEGKWWQGGMGPEIGERILDLWL